MFDRRMILCLGANRTGTSAVTAAIAALGADLGFSAVYANDENQKGFFEHPELNALNERILMALGGAWDSASFIGREALMSDPKNLNMLRSDALAFLDTSFATSGLAVLKDPRMCLLLDFWIPLIKEAGFAQIDCVHVLRDPLQAALSQRQRVLRRPEYYEMGRTLQEGAALWLSYMAQMWDRFEDAGHMVLSYDMLVDHPETAITVLADGLKLVPDAGKRSEFITNFMDTSLRHSRGEETDRASIMQALPQVFEVYALLAPLCQKPGLRQDDIAPIRALAKDARPLMDHLQSAAAARISNAKRLTSAELSRIKDRLQEAEKTVALTRAHLDEQRRTYEEDRAGLAKASKAASLAFDAELAARESAFEAELTAKELAYKAELSAQDAAFREDRARVVREYAALQDNTVQAFEARLEAQKEHDRLIFERDLQAVRTAEAQAVANLAALKASRSWKITAPLRLAGQQARKSLQKTSALWIRFNHQAKRSYRAIDKRSPWLANVLRRMIVPAIRMGNRVILRSDYVPTPTPLHSGFVEGQTQFQFDFQRPQALQNYRPLVSVLVPNYNHAPFLRQRLDSIYAQTWTQFEVILMDDCSTDDSRAILQEYADRYPDRTRLLLNDKNSGGAFKQWEKGLRAARGELIWVAESDDWCSANLLETLVPFFANQAVQLAFVPSHFMNAAGSEQVWSMGEYLSGVGPDRWGQPFVVPAPQIVREAFAEKNIIPNASSAVFRLHDRLEVMENSIWREMRTCGDWVFYLNQIRGGLLAYSPLAQNYYRQHAANTSVTSFSKDSYYAEHEIVAKTIQRHYSVDPSVFQRQQQDLILHWTRNRAQFDRAAFDACYSIARIMDEASQRKPKLLMAGYAFCSGGGETFPITLANEMKTAGYDITFLNCMQEDELPGIRNLLARDIPVVSNFEDLNGIVRAFDIDVVHSHHAWVDNTILDILPENSPVKTVISLHGMYETMQDEQLKRTLPRLVKRTSALVYTAEKNLTALVSRGMVRADQLPRIDNALAIGPVTPIDRARLAISHDAFVLAMVARAIPTKGWEEAIEATRLAREKSGADIHLVIVGDGPEYDRMKGSVPDFIHLEGFQTNIRGYFAMADVGLLPSRFKGESFPLVLIDCLHAGKAVIASDVGEIPYMLSTSTGVAGAIFGLKDWQIPIEDLALQISDLARNPRLLAEMNARVPEAARRFDPTVMRDKYDAVYQSVAAPDEAQQAAE